MKRTTKIIIALLTTLLAAYVIFLFVNHSPSSEGIAPAVDTPIQSLPSTDTEKCDAGDAKACVAQAFKSDEPLLWNTKACTLGSGVGCANVAGSYYGEGQLDKSKTFFEKACELKDLISCTNLGVFAEQEKNTKAALGYFNTACMSGHGPSCVSWKNNAEKLCKSDFQACTDLAGEIRDNKEVIDANYLLSVACEAGHTPACP